MTSTESPDQNEYEDSFKRFKTLFIVGAACFCVGVTVVILGNRFQLYEVQRLGIIFSSFGIGWIVLAISYLVYMKWCFIPGESENTPQQVVNRSVGRERAIIPRTLRRPQSSSKVSETAPPPEEEILGKHSSLAGRSFGRSTSLVPNAQRPSPSVNGSERQSLHSSRKFERRSYSLRNVRDRSYCKNCKRLTTSFKNFQSPLLSESNFDKRVPFTISDTKPAERDIDTLPFLPRKLENKPSANGASSEKYFESTSFPEKNSKSTSLSPNRFQRPLNELKNTERQPTFVIKSERQQSLAHTSAGVVNNFERLSEFVNDDEGQPSLFRSSERQMVAVKNFERPTTFLGHSKPNFETKTIPGKNCEMQQNKLESFERQLSLSKDSERQRILENYKQQFIAPKHSCSSARRSNEKSLPEEEPLSKHSPVQKDSDGSQFCKIDLDTQDERSSPPDYYAVVLSLHKADE